MRKMPAVPSLKRSVQSVRPKVELIIVCEGVNTEPFYFSDCVTNYGAGLVRLNIVPGAGVPITLVNEAIRVRDECLTRIKRSPNSFDSCFRVWAVFDRDEHPRVDEALALAEENKIEVAFSNPCFEVWPILHIEDYGNQDDRHTLQRRLAEKMEGYDHGGGARINFAMIKDDFDPAYARAERLLKAREAENCPFGRPSTTVGRLVLKIIQNGKGFAR